MAVSIPQMIIPNYSTAQVNINPAGTPNVGSAVKDLPPDAETSMKKAHNVTVAKLKESFVSDTERYNTNFQAATSRAVEAEKVVSKERLKKIIAIAALVATILGIIGVAIATAITGTLPLLFIAIPLGIALAPSSYYTHIFRKGVEALDDAIAAPKKLISPVLHLPEYHASRDLELKQSRLDAQNAMASKTTLQQVVQADYSTDEITRYALLDRMTPIAAAKRPAFYAKCVQLISAYGVIVKEKENYLDTAHREYSKISSELEKWKSQEDRHIITQERSLRDREIMNAHRPHRRPGVVVQVVRQVDTMFTRFDLENKKIEVSTAYAKGLAQNCRWIDQTKQNINTAYDQAVSLLEQHFTAAKAVASA